MTKYFLYARKSTDDEHRQVLSIDAQMAELRAFAKHENLNVIHEFIEKQSAKIPGRPIFNEMLSRIEQHGATGILAWHPDRLARNSVDGGRIIYLLDTNALTALKFPQFWFEDTPQGKFMLNIAFGQSKYYVDSLSENTKRGLRQKVRRGEYPCIAPNGYLNDPRAKSIVIDKKRAPIIRRAFELYAKNNSRLEDISNFLAQHGIISRNGVPLHRDRITQILNNPFYYGHFRYAGEVHEGKHEPIVSKKLFDDTQEVLKRRGRPQQGTSYEPETLCGLITCASCGMMITGERHTKRQKNGNVHHYTYYRCSRKNKALPCYEPFIREEELARQLSSLLLSICLKPDWAAQLRKMVDTDATQAAQSVATFTQTARAEITELDKKLQRLLDGYLEQDIEREIYRAQKAALMSAKKTLQDQIARRQKSQTAWLEPLRNWINDAEMLDKIATGSDLQGKKAAAKKIYGSNLRLAQRALAWEARSAADFSDKNPWEALRAAHLEMGEDKESQVVARPPDKERAALYRAERRSRAKRSAASA